MLQVFACWLVVYGYFESNSNTITCGTGHPYKCELDLDGLVANNKLGLRFFDVQILEQMLFYFKVLMRSNFVDCE